MCHHCQDPYHEVGQAQGLSFSVHEGVPIPRSLRNIYKELNADLGLPVPTHGSLVSWASQGVLMLNDVLTVYDGQANSHKGWGWERFTGHIIDVVEQQPHPVAYLLWGKSAQKKVEQNHLGEGEYPRLIVQSNHPSPLSASRGFLAADLLVRSMLFWRIMVLRPSTGRSAKVLAFDFCAYRLSVMFMKWNRNQTRVNLAVLLVLCSICLACMQHCP